MVVVVDASAIAAIAFGEPDGPTLTAHLSGQSLIAPTLLDYELANIAWKKARRHPVLAPAIQAALDAATHLPISRVAVPAVEMLRLARAQVSRRTTRATSGWRGPGMPSW